MASEHSRRALLGGGGLALVAGALPAVIAAPAAAVTSTEQWDIIEADYLRIRDRWRFEMKRFDAVAQRHFATPPQATEEEYAAAEAEEGRHCGFDSEAMDRLNNTPAPHMRAVLMKLQLIDEFALPMGPVIADVRRLAGEA